MKTTKKPTFAGIRPLQLRPRQFYRWGAFTLLTLAGLSLFSLLLHVLRGVLSSPIVALLYILPVTIAAVFLGRFGGITAAVAGFLFFNYLFIPPYYSFRVNHPQDLLVLMVFLGVSVLISTLIARMRSNLDTAGTREQEIHQLYQLSVEFGELHETADIIRVLTENMAHLFPHGQLEITVRGFSPPPETESIIPQADTPGKTLVIELSTPEMTLGEIRVRQNSSKVTHEQERLARIIARLGALALHRVLLIQNETHTRVVEESDRLKSAILSSVSHDLRTPLASIQAAATTLFNPELALEPDASAELQSLLLEETENMAQLIGNLLNMSRLETGLLTLQRQWNALAEIVDTSLRRLRRVTRDTPPRVDVPDDLPLVPVDAVLLEQVFLNLVRNSIKYSPPGTPVEILAAAEVGQVHVQVRNAGPKIPAQHIQHIFEKFYQMPGKDAARGTGLGLSICKGIVEAHGGTVWAENLPVGVSFHFTLPTLWDGAAPQMPGDEEEGA
jgi:two-component system sensor histidine kinase KdpD